jgi:hypothetical protein
VVARVAAKGEIQRALSASGRTLIALSDEFVRGDLHPTVVKALHRGPRVEEDDPHLRAGAPLVWRYGK